MHKYHFIVNIFRYDNLTESLYIEIRLKGRENIAMIRVWVLFFVNTN